MRPWLTAALSLAACGGPFAAARKEGTSLAYAEFVARYPDHGKAALAARRAEALDWASAVTADDADAYSLYIVTHPTGPNIDEARARAEARAWDAAAADGSREALSDYMAAFPMGAHRGLVDAMMEDAWIAEARAIDSVDSWGRYLFRYPDGRYVEEARKRRDTLAWEATVRDATRTGYERYLREHPRGAHRTEARTWLESLALKELQPVLVIGASWRPERGRAADRKRLVDQVTRNLIEPLKRDFALRPLIIVDGSADQVREQVPLDGAGLGWLVVAVSGLWCGNRAAPARAWSAANRWPFCVWTVATPMSSLWHRIGRPQAMPRLR